jgi:flagellar hook-length control protein FliK
MVGPTLDVYVAEQVKYWISNDVQSAEMKLDGLGGNPVEVSISMQGNEAQVAFRTDELHAREALEKASLHLKDMLQREGVVLTGVTVSTAGAGDQGAQERRPRSGARQAEVTSALPVTNQAVLGGNRVTGRALDLFV